jgi:hypothetical protein
MRNEDSAHHSGSDPDEMGAVLPIDAGPVHQAEIGLVDQGGGLKSVIGTLAPHKTGCEAMQVVMEKIEETVCGLDLTDFSASQFDEELSGLTLSGLGHTLLPRDNSSGFANKSIAKASHHCNRLNLPRSWEGHPASRKIHAGSLRSLHIYE